jgi:hypothetical protein
VKPDLKYLREPGLKQASTRLLLGKPCVRSRCGLVPVMLTAAAGAFTCAATSPPPLPSTAVAAIGSVITSGAAASTVTGAITGLVTGATGAMSDAVTGAGAIVPPLLLATADRDIFSVAFDWFADAVAGMSVALWWWFIKAAAALEIVTIGCGLVFKSCRQSLNAGALMAINWSVFVLGWLLIAALPLGSLHVAPAHKGWILAVALMAIFILPWRLAWFLTPIEGRRRILAISMYGLMAVLLLIQLLFL